MEFQTFDFPEGTQVFRATEIIDGQPYVVQRPILEGHTNEDCKIRASNLFASIREYGFDNINPATF